MNRADEATRRLLATLQERAKELNCLYEVEEILNQPDAPMDQVCRALVATLPRGWQYPEICVARVALPGKEHATNGFQETEWRLSASILAQGEPAGEVSVFYTEHRPSADEGPFLKEERRLIDAIAERISVFLLQRRLRSAHERWKDAEERIATGRGADWRVILDFLRRTDPRLLARLTRKMINFLCWSGVSDAEKLLLEFDPAAALSDAPLLDENRPQRRRSEGLEQDVSDRTFAMAVTEVGDAEMLSRVQTWIEEDRSSALLGTLEKGHSDLGDIAEAVERYRGAGVEESTLPVTVRRSLHVSLLRRLFTDQMDFLNVAKDFVSIDDVHEVLQRTLYPPRSHGKLGGKSAGLFLATKILQRSTEEQSSLRTIRTPKTWYITSDALVEFIHHNSLEDLYNRKYLDSETLRREYPYIVQLFKNSHFPPEFDQGLSAALDEFEDRPLIVRSSSLLEDRSGATFAGKYKSLFVANQGSKRTRLAALRDAIAEVYASIFSPDPIEYRAERGLLDMHEEMAIMIQEVVGRRVGRYFFPTYAGVAFSNNEFRWSPRIRREDGLVRLVPGLGTRAVDRLSDDFPFLMAPGQPALRVNASADEVIRYSPHKMDVIDIEANALETVDVRELLRECGDGFPRVRDIVSIVDGDRLRRPTALEPDWQQDELAVNFEGLLTRGDFVDQMRGALDLLRTTTGTPVDLEFASDGESLYLVQCRTQSYSLGHAPAAIPRDIPLDRVFFSSHRFVSNGWVPDIGHVVYVDPDRYAAIEDLQTLKDVARAVGRVNKVLPKRGFILMGPGRWGSRGDIRLGVGVTYSDINHSAVLVEIARKKGRYVPELSFGTHFFQDLVEADIRYIPLYPDEEPTRFNEDFVRRGHNLLPEIAPEFSRLEDIVRVIDVRRQTEGNVLRILLNADLNEAMAVFSEPSAPAPARTPSGVEIPPRDDEHWRWRMQMARRIAANLDPERFGVRALYVFGSAKNATARPGSDLDLIIHFAGSGSQKADLLLWLDGWSRSLAEINYLRTGYRSEGLLDVHLVTDEDIARRSSFAAKIDAVTDAAQRLPLPSDSST